MANLVFVTGDDWTGIYVDGVLKHEGHSLTPAQILNVLGIKFKIVEADSDWLMDVGNLPDKLENVKLEE